MWTKISVWFKNWKIVFSYNWKKSSIQTKYIFSSWKNGKHWNKIRTLSPKGFLDLRFKFWDLALEMVTIHIFYNFPLYLQILLNILDCLKHLKSQVSVWKYEKRIKCIQINKNSSTRYESGILVFMKIFDVFTIKCLNTILICFVTNYINYSIFIYYCFLLTEIIVF